MWFSAEVNAHGEIQLRGNSATVGGGLCGAGWGGDVKLGRDALLRVEGNEAAEDGGGVALLTLSRLSMTSNECTPDCLNLRDNGSCNAQCLQPGCSFDQGQCTYRFEKAGEMAMEPCMRDMHPEDPSRSFCTVWRETDPEVCGPMCMVSSCDWSEGSAGCGEVYESLRSCPLFAALSLRSILAQPELVYVKAGGTARGFGRCAGPCRTDPHPPLPAWCNGTEACTSSPDAPWCPTIDDESKLVVRVREGEVSDEGDMTAGLSWGECSPDHPRLPGVDFDYDKNHLLGLLELSSAQLFRKYPGCGQNPVIIRSNKAGRNGGGLFKSSCSVMPERQRECLIGGITEEAAVAIVLHSNSAQAAGGGAFVACHETGDCSKRILISLLPSPPSFLDFADNQAGTYGDDMATNAQTLIAVSAESGPTSTVPGQSLIDLTVALLDAKGQQIKSPPDAALPALLSLAVCPRGQPSCSVSTNTLQPVSYLRLPAGKMEASSAEQGVMLERCVDGEETVVVHLAVVAETLEIPSLSKTVELQCGSCQKGQQLVVSVRNGIRTWSCESCSFTEYVVNAHQGCHRCPVGATCNGADLVGRVENSTWQADMEKGIYLLTGCPAGHQLINYLEADSAKAFFHDAQLCMPCTVNQYLSPLGSCQVCPVWGQCDGQSFVSLVPQATWAVDEALEQLRLLSCPPGYILIRSHADPARENCVACPAKSYLLEQAKVRDGAVTGPWVWAGEQSSKLCLPCPTGAVCEGARVSSTEGYWRHPSNFTCPPDACNSAGDCDMRRCTAAAVDAQLVVGLGRAQVDWQQRAIVLACPPGVCRAEDECEQGNWGPVCGRCKPEHARQGHRCYHCNPDQEFRARVGMYVVFPVLAALLWALLSWQPILIFAYKWCTARGAPSEASFTPDVPMWHSPISAARVAVFRTSFTMMVAAFQIAAALFQNYSIKWPDTVSTFFSLSTIANIVPYEFGNLACLWKESTLMERTVFGTIGPIVGVAMHSLPVICLSVAGLCGLRNAQLSQHVWQLFWSTLTLICVILYPSASAAALRPFHCHSELELVVRDWELRCPSLTQGFEFYWSFVFTLCYPVGLPCGVLIALIWFRVPQMAHAKYEEALLKALYRHAESCIPGESQKQALHASYSNDSKHSVRSQHGPSIRPGADTLRVACRSRQMSMFSVLSTSMEIDSGQGSTGKDSTRRFSSRSMTRTQLFAFVDRVKERHHAASGRVMPAGWWPRLLSACKAQSSSAVGELDLDNMRERDLRQWLVRAARIMMADGDLAIEEPHWGGGEEEGEERALSCLGGLIRPYKVQFWYWESVEMLRKLTLASMIPMLVQTPANQVAMALFILLFYLVAVVWGSPYTNSSQNLLQAYIQLTLFCTLYYGQYSALFCQTSLNAADCDNNRVEWSLVAMYIAVLLGPLIKTDRKSVV